MGSRRSIELKLFKGRRITLMGLRRGIELKLFERKTRAFIRLRQNIKLELKFDNKIIIIKKKINKKRFKRLEILLFKYII